MRKPLLVALSGQPAEFAEGKPLPFVSVGEWNFKDSIGPVAVTDDDLDLIVRNFHSNARRQDLGIVINEEHLPTEYREGEPIVGPGAVGWFKNMYREGDTVYVVPDWNRAGEQLLAEDRYRAVSPELLLNWTDPETEQEFGMTAAGLALTTMPKMKGLATQGRPLAASEGRARVLAFAEPSFAAGHIDKPMDGISVVYAFPDRKRLPLTSAASVRGAMARFQTVDAGAKERDAAWARLSEAAEKFAVRVPKTWKELKASECAALLLAEGDGEPSDLLPCLNAPACGGSCPGFTRAADDGDGDIDPAGICRFTADCNGYIPVLPGRPMLGTSEYWFKEFSQAERDAAAKSGAALPDGSYPIENGSQLKDAIQSVGRAKDQAKARAHIVKRAKALGMEDQIPESWEMSEGATFQAPDTAPNNKPGGPMGKENTTATEGAQNTDPAKTTAEGAVKANETAPATGAPAADDKPINAADFAETNQLLMTERAERRKVEERLKASEGEIAAMKQAMRDRETTERLAKTTDRLDALIRTGRITAAEKEKYTENIAKFAENDFMLDALEARPANSAIDMSEKGVDGSGADGLSDSAKLDGQARAIMAERVKQNPDEAKRKFSERYKDALLEAGRLGYRG